MPRIDPERIRRILVIQIRPFGDVLRATSYLGALKKRFPHARIDFLVSAPFDGALRHHPHLDDIIVSPSGGRLAYLWGRLTTITRIRAARYDIVIDQQNGTGSGIANWLSGAPCRVGWADGKGRIAHNVHAVPTGPSTYSASCTSSLKRNMTRARLSGEVSAQGRKPPWRRRRRRPPLPRSPAPPGR